MTDSRGSAKRERAYGAVRTTLIGYGVAAYAFLPTRASTDASSQASGSWVSAHGYVLTGLGVQLLLVLARALLRRYAPDWASTGQGNTVLEIVADGATVLLFALATLGAITPLANDL